jgi:hypothetical protein
MLVLEGSVAEAGCELQQEHSASGVGADLAAEHSCASVSSSTAQQPRAVSRQQSQQARAAQPRKLWSARGTPPGSRPGSAQGSRPSSASNTGTTNSQRSSVQDASAAPRKQSSAGSLPGPVPSYAAGTRSSSAKGPGAATGGKGAAGAVRQLGCPLPGATRIKAGSSKAQTAGKLSCWGIYGEDWAFGACEPAVVIRVHAQLLPAANSQNSARCSSARRQSVAAVRQSINGMPFCYLTSGAWQGPSQQEWEQLQHQLAQQQQLVEQLQQQAAAAHAQHAAEVQTLREISTAAHVALQVRVGQNSKLSCQRSAFSHDSLCNRACQNRLV